MAKQGNRILRARRTGSSTDDDSLLVRSAESLGRVIGSLQRQVQEGSKRVSTMTDDALNALPDMPRFDGVSGATRAKSRKASGARRSPARKTTGAGNGAGPRKTRRATNGAGARKSAGARKEAGAGKTARARKAAGSRKSNGSRKRKARGASSGKR